METKTIDNTNRFIPTKRIAMDGKSWWVVYDLKQSCYSTCTLFGRYRLKRDCQFAIDYISKHYSQLLR